MTDRQSGVEVLRAMMETYRSRCDSVVRPRAPLPLAAPSETRLAAELTVLMPCLNEAETIATCVSKAREFLSRSGVCGEVVVADNGSTDGSIEKAVAAGARVVHVPRRGYGSALLAGIEAARGEFVIMGDADDSYDFGNLDGFLAELRSGADLVMGNRFVGGIQAGAMPLLHKYLGNPVLSFLGRLFYRSSIGDFHCGLRGFRRRSILALGLRAPGMEFASEMIVRATLDGLRISEVPTVLSRDGRSRPPHLRTWRDGWRHLRFLLLLSPRWLFLYPGMALLALSIMLQSVIATGPIMIAGLGLDIHTMLYATGFGLIGVQLVVFAVIARAIALSRGLLPMTGQFERFVAAFTIERGLLLGAAIGLMGFGFALYTLALWHSAHLAALDPTIVMRRAIPAVGLTISGAQLIFGSFVVGLIDPKSRFM